VKSNGIKVGSLVRQNPKHLYRTCYLADLSERFGFRRVIVATEAIGMYLGTVTPAWSYIERLQLDLVLFGEERVYLPIGTIEEVSE